MCMRGNGVYRGGGSQEMLSDLFFFGVGSSTTQMATGGPCKRSLPIMFPCIQFADEGLGPTGNLIMAFYEDGQPATRFKICFQPVNT